MHATPARPHAVARRWTAVLLVELLLLAALAVLAYYQTFSLFIEYDDEGYFMLQVKHVLAGHRLYEDLWTLYGPVYFFYKWLIHGLGGFPLTHDVVRLTAIAIRLATGVVAAVAAFGLTRNLVLAGVAQVLVTFHLVTIQSEPGHPQELCGLLTMLLVAIPAVARRRRATPVPIALGLLIAALTMTKVNLGLFAGLAVWMSILSLAPATRAGTALRIASSAALVTLPALLMRSRLAEPPAWHFAASQALAVAALLSIPLARRDGTSGRRALVVFTAGWVGGVTVIVLALLVRGTSVAALLDSLVVSPSRLPSLFVYMPADVFRIPLVAAAALALALGVRASERVRLNPHAIGVGKLALASAALIGSWRLDFAMLLSGVTPFAWVGLLPPAGVPDSDRQRLARLVSCWLAVLLPLQAFPIAGSQAYFGTLAHVIVGTVCLADGLVWLDSLSGAFARRALRAAPALILLLVMASWASQVRTWRDLYLSSVPLDLPGAARVRVSRYKANVLRTLTETLRERADTFFCAPGFNSLYFWTGKEPPTPDVVSEVIQFYSDARQAAMIDALLQHHNPVVVHYQGLAAPYPPFEERLRQQFTPLMRVGQYQLLVPR